MENLIVLFIVIPLAVGLISVGLVNRPILSRVLGTLSFSATLLLAIGLLISIHDGSGVLVSQMGDWSAPFGISIVFDHLSGL